MPKAKMLPSGSWRVQLFVGNDPTEPHKYKSFTAPTRREAELAAAEYAAGIKKAPGSNMTLSQAIDAYINAKEAVLSPTTTRSYKSMQKNRLKSILDCPLSSLTHEKIQIAISEDAKRLAPKTIANTHGLLSPVLKMFLPQFALNTTLPQKDKTEITVPTRDQVKTVYSHFKGTKWEIPFLLASQCGLRLSEICGLTYADITDAGIIVDKASVIGKQGPILKKPKSHAGFRVIPCSATLKAIINAEKTADNDKVCKLTYYTVSSNFPRKLAHMGVSKFRFHDLRHYYASEGLLLNVPLKYMAELMGHGSTNMLIKVYQHTFPDKKIEFAQSLIDTTDKLLR